MHTRSIGCMVNTFCSGATWSTGCFRRIHLEQYWTWSLTSRYMSKLHDFLAGLGLNDQLELNCWGISVSSWPFSIQQVVLHSQPWFLFDKRLELLTAIGTSRPGNIIHKTVNNTGDGRIICLFLMPANHPTNRGGLKQIRNNIIIKCTWLNSRRIGGNSLT